MPRLNNNIFYLNALKKHGQNPKGLNWRNNHSQQVRFETIYHMIEEFFDDDTTLVDAGCGFGDFYLYLREKNIDIDYIGYEIVEKFINIAKKKTSQNIELKDILHDKLVKADFYVASGSLNILTRFETFLFIRRCFEHSKVGFVFNLLEGDFSRDDFNFFSQDEIRELGAELGAKVTIKTGYFANDFTVVFEKTHK